MIVNIDERWPGIFVVSLEGQLDQSTSPRLRRAIASLLKQETLDQLVVDLSKLNYIESSGIATLVEGLQQCKKRSVRFVLAGLSPPVEAVFDLANLKGIFEMVLQVDAALSTRT